MSTMASRKKKRHAPAQTVGHGLPPRRPSIWFTLGAGLVIGAIVGVAVGVTVFFANRKPVDLGVVVAKTIAAPAQIPDKELYDTYAGSASCRECHAKAFDAWTSSHH